MDLTVVVIEDMYWESTFSVPALSESAATLTLFASLSAHDFAAFFAASTKAELSPTVIPLSSLLLLPEPFITRKPVGDVYV